jgi:hypothetical protein
VDLEAIFCVQQERTVAADNTVTVGGLRLQIAPQSSRWSYAKCRVKVCEHLDGRWSVRYGPHVLGWYAANGRAVKEKLKRAERQQLTTKSGQITCYKKRPTSLVIDSRAWNQPASP